MIKHIKFLFIALLISLLFPIKAYAEEQASYIKDTTQNKYGKCIDLQEAYSEINKESQAYTGQSASIEASKKANVLSALTSLFSIIAGNQYFK